MPIDVHESDDDNKDPAMLGSKRRFTDFDCPDCSANNPHDDGFRDGDEVHCSYCGQEFKVIVKDDGRLRLKEA